MARLANIPIYFAPDAGTPPNQSFSRSDGVRTGVTTFQQEAAASTGIQATLMDFHANDYATAMNNRLMRNGGNAASANLAMGGFNFSSLGAGTARTNAPTIAQIEDGSLLLIGSVAGTNTITGSLTPAITAYATGQLFSFVPANNNTGATTININSVGAASIKQAGSFALAGDELVAGVAAYIFYDGTNFELLNPQRIYVGVGENDTAERTFETVSSGSAAGNTYTRRILGSGSNAVATLRDYIGTTKILEATTSLYSILQAALFGAQADFTDISTPAAPSAGLTRVYTKSGRLYIRASGGSETLLAVSQDPTVQKLTTGSAATYTPTAGTVRIRVRMVGPGGGGSACVTNAGGNGSAATSFTPSGGSAWTAAAGNGGVLGIGAGGAGGSGGSNGTGTLITRFSGANGGSGQNSAGAGEVNAGGAGGATPFGGNGASITSAAGVAAVANTGSGGGGGSTNLGTSGSGGGAGEYVEFWMNATQLNGSATYTIGTGGAGGLAGTQPGGNGAAGVIIIEEFYF